MSRSSREEDRLSDLERSFERFMDHVFTRDKRYAVSGSRVWTPSTDVFETTHHIVIKCELAGIKPGDIEISSVGNTVIITGSRYDAPQTDMTSYYQMEIQYGPFEVRVPLPMAVKIREAKARYEDGFLKVLLPKAPKPSPGRIVVRFEF